jgi:hypothetical protein
MGTQKLSIELESDIIDSFDDLGIEISQFIKIKAIEFLKDKTISEAGVAESGKGAGLRTLSRRSPRVRITPPA